jgi:hypothetical protein
MLVELISVDVLSLVPSGGLISETSLAVTAVATVEVEESGTICVLEEEGCAGGEDGVGVISGDCGGSLWSAGAGSGSLVAGKLNDAGRGDSGSNVVFSLMEMTIFSRSSGEICFSWRAWRLLRLPVDSVLLNSGRALVGHDRVASSMELSQSDEAVESRLVERSGMFSVDDEDRFDRVRRGRHV